MQTLFKKIILATNFSDISKETSYYALQLAQTYKVGLKTLRVFNTSAWNVPSHYYLVPAGPRGFDGFVEGFEESRQRGKNV